MHGDLEPAEHPRFGLLREIEEELGVMAAKWIADQCSNEKSFLQKVDEAEGEKRIVITFGVYLAPDEFWEFFSRIRLHPDSGGLVLATKKKLLAALDLQPSHKEHGVPDREIYMFPDEKQTALRVFDALST